MKNSNDNIITKNQDTGAESIGNSVLEQPQSTAIESHALENENEAEFAMPKTSCFVHFMTRGAEIHDSFRRDVLRETEFCSCVDAMLEISAELSGGPELIVFSRPFKMAEELRRYLLTALFAAADKGVLEDHLRFKAHLYQGFMSDAAYEHRKSYFANCDNVRFAEFNEGPPTIPIADDSAYKILLERDGLKANGVVSAHDIEGTRTFFSMLRRCKGLGRVRKALISQMSDVLISELAAHAMEGTPIPMWLKIKYRLLGRLMSFDSQKTCRRFFKKNAIDEILARMHATALG